MNPFTTTTIKSIVTNRCNKCGKSANPYYLMPDNKIYCQECYKYIHCIDIKDYLLKKCYDALLSAKDQLFQCSNLLDHEFKYITTASEVSKQKIKEIENVLEEIRKNNENVQS